MPDLGEPLSRREHDVLQAMAHGASNKEIASELVISPNTVKVHVRNIFTKMGASSRTEVVTLAIHQGLLANGQDDTAEEQVDDPSPAAAAVVDLQPQDTPAQPIEISAESISPTLPDKQLKRSPLYALVALLAVVLVAGLAYFFVFRTPETVEPAATEALAAEPLGEPGWYRIPQLDQARSGMVLTSIGSDLYLIGGTTADGISSDVLRFDTRANRWNAQQPKPTAVTNAGAAVAIGQIYVVGGATEAGATAVVEAYSPSTNTWRAVASLPEPLEGAAVMASGERIFVFGGENDGSVSASSFVYDPLEDSWRPLADMPQPRAQTAGALLLDQLYVLGGTDGQQELASCARFDPDPAVESWSDCPAMLEARAGLRAVTLARKLYVVGGGSEQPVTYGELFDAENETWQVLNVPALNSAENLLNPGMAVIETRFYLIGGEQDSQLQAASYYYIALENRIFIPRATTGE